MTAAPNVAVVQTGVANLASVAAGLRRAGAEPEIVDDVASVESAKRLVLPGVGAFAAAMERLRELGLDGPLVRRVREGRPTLVICLGLQLLTEASEESPGVAGLGVIPGRITRFPTHVRVPQLGWNAVHANSDARWLRSGYAYFANSYRLVEAPTGWSVAFADHGGRFVAALERGSVLACQFHPELSGPWGVSLLRRWLAASKTEVAPC